MSEAYKNAGVDIDKGNEVASFIAERAKSTFTAGVLRDIGSFGSLFDLSFLKGSYKEPVLVSGTDGVGTKLKIAQEVNNHKNVGFDLVGMCVNDILTCGASPLFFLDYFATGKLRVEVAKEVLSSIAEACGVAKCALIGGETAEMPGMYKDGEYDLAGFAVGIVDKTKIIDGSTIEAGDVVLGVESNGLHSNGFSLVRKLLDPLDKTLYYSRYVTDLKSTLGEALLAPTRIYVSFVHSLLNKGFEIKGMAHITGGGFYDNLPRILPKGLGIAIEKRAWKIPPIFKLIQNLGEISCEEMYRVFNMGIGYVLITSPEEALRISAYLKTNILDIGTVIQEEGVAIL